MRELGDLPDQFNDENLAKYPELARTRKLFIDLFKDKSPLVNLGYTSKQIIQAQPVLELLLAEGKVLTYGFKSHYLDFVSKERGEKEALSIDNLPSKRGYYLIAFRDNTPSLPPVEELLADIFGNVSQPNVFSDLDTQIAHVALFEGCSDINNLSYLVKELSSGFAFEGMRLGTYRENPLTKLARLVGQVSTYRAAWVDETNNEFVVRVDPPNSLGIDPVFASYKKLNKITDMRGSVVPVGKKPSTSENKVMQTLRAKERQLVIGKLVFGNK